MNMVEKVTDQIKEIIKEAVRACIDKEEFNIKHFPEIVVEVPRERAHGDFASNIAMLLTKQTKKNPRLIAQAIVDKADYEGTYVESVEIAGPGFINFHLNNMWLYKTVEIVYNQKENYGKVDIGKGKRVMVEFVSANPTGPMHMGNARGAALGDSLASILEAAGYNVTREFYINDAGNQIDKFGKSLEYQGQDIIDHMKEFIDKEKDKYLDTPSEDRRQVFIKYALKRR